MRNAGGLSSISIIDSLIRLSAAGEHWHENYTAKPPSGIPDGGNFV